MFVLLIFSTRFSIKRAPELCEVLNLRGDTYTERPNELVRKAIDEFMIGLQFYVLFTLSHSAIKSPSTQPISFKYISIHATKDLTCMLNHIKEVIKTDIDRVL